MTSVRVNLHGDGAAADRLRDVLGREGFRIVESNSSEPEITVVGTDDRIEDLERTVRELRNLDVAKSQFLANVSHELRTPLTAIVTYGEVLRDGLLGDVNHRQREAVQSVISSSRQLLSMIEEILTYARTGARAIELDPTEWDIADVIRDVHGMNASLIRQKRLRYEVRIDPDLPCVRADRDKVVHVLGNLIGNAVEFTDARGTLGVKVGRAPEDPAWLEIVVADSGIGIDPEHHEMIFQEFAQVDSSRARRHHGTGLGLAIARNFIQLHGGQIRVESERGAGSRFLFTLPTVEADEHAGST